jgi:pimeloyl-ACP methyl ester carboxylesterase
VGRHFRPLTEPIPVFRDDELLRLQMPLQFFAGSKDMLLRSEASVRRLVKLLPHAAAHLLGDRGHVILGKSEEILSFLLRSTGT